MYNIYIYTKIHILYIDTVREAAPLALLGASNGTTVGTVATSRAGEVGEGTSVGTWQLQL